MSPAIYSSWLFTEGDSLETKQTKLYLAVTSAEEQAYTLGAAIGECRKQLTTLDAQVREMKVALQEIKREGSESGAQP